MNSYLMILIVVVLLAVSLSSCSEQGFHSEIESDNTAVYHRISQEEAKKMMQRMMGASGMMGKINPFSNKKKKESAAAARKFEKAEKKRRTKKKKKKKRH